MPAKKVLTAGAIGVAVACALGFYWPFHREPKALRLPGTVEIQEVRLASKVGGRVKDVQVRQGQVIGPGQVLATLEAPELEAQREQAYRRLQAAQATLEKLRTGARPEEKAVADAAVKAAEAHVAKVKAGWREEELEQARKELAALDAEVEFARTELERERYLAPKGVSTESRLEQVKADLKRYSAQTAASRAKLAMLTAGPRKEEIAEAEAEVVRARAQMELVKAPTRSEDIAEAEARVTELAARVTELDAQLAEAVVKAPEAAVVEVLTIRPGDILPANQPAARVLRAGDLWVKAYVPATELGKVKLNQAVEVTIDSHPGRKFAGTVEYIASAAEFTPRNVQSVDERANQMFAIQVRVPDTEGIFKSGMAADVFVPVE